MTFSETKTYDFITINQLFEKLPESELKAIRMYFDQDYPCKFNKKRYLCKVLKIALVYNDGSQKCKEFNEFYDLFPGCSCISVPAHAFCNIQTITNRMRKLYIKAERIPFKNSFYHDCKAVEVENQTKLVEFLKQRTQVYLDDMAKSCTIKDDEIDDDDF